MEAANKQMAFVETLIWKPCCTGSESSSPFQWKHTIHQFYANGTRVYMRATPRGSPAGTGFQTKGGTHTLPSTGLIQDVYVIVGNFPSLLVHLLLHMESSFPQNVSLHFPSSTQPLISKSHWLLHRRLRRLVWVARWPHTADKVLQSYSRVRKGQREDYWATKNCPGLSPWHHPPQTQTPAPPLPLWKSCYCQHLVPLRG